MTDLIQEKLDSWQTWRERQLSLDAGWGMVGASVGRVYRPWLYSMSADFYPGARVHVSGEEIDVLEEMAISLAQQIYHAKYVDLHTMSGGNANSVLLCALTAKGDTIMAFEDPLGHRSMREDGIGGFIDRNYVPIPIDAENLSIDLEGFREKAYETRPKLIMLGSAMYIFLEPFREIVSIAREIGAMVSCDVSHTFGYLHCSILNYRSTLWGREKARAVAETLMPYIDVILDNEEDFEIMLGIKAENTDSSYSDIDPESYRKVAERVMEKYPHIKVVGTSLREVKTACLNNWQTCMMTRRGFFTSAKYENIEINDRVGGGDSFASGLVWCLLSGYEDQAAIDFAAAYSALCHTIRNDWNLVTRQEAEALAAGGNARVRR